MPHLITGKFVEDTKKDFARWVDAQLCGRDWRYHGHFSERAGGQASLIGAIDACIERGINTDEAIVLTAARFSHCRRHTVERFLDDLTGEDRAKHRWFIQSGRYRKWPVSQEEPARVFIPLAA